MDLTKKHCVPCEGGVDPYTPEQTEVYMKLLPDDWQIVNGKVLRKEFKFETYLAGIDFVKRVGELANSEDHHPDIHVFFKKVVVELSTHAIDGLSENDFIVASKIELF